MRIITKGIGIRKKSLEIFLVLIGVVFVLQIHAAFAEPTIAFQFPEGYQYFDAAANTGTAIITVVDSTFAGNGGLPDTITITVKSTTDTDGISLTLVETGADDGVFSNTGLTFMDDNNKFSLSDIITVRYDDPTFNSDSNAIDTVNVIVVSSSDTIGLNPFVLKETGKNSGIFTSKLSFTSSLSSGKSLHAEKGDIISVFFPCETSNGIIVPNPDSSVGAIAAAVGDILTASYPGAVDGTSKILLEGGCGGGGGGLVINPLVLDLAGGADGDVIAPAFVLSRVILDKLPLPDEIKAILRQQDPFKPIPAVTDPSVDLPLSINNKKFAISSYSQTIETSIEETGKPLKLQLKLNDGTGVEHVALYTNLRDSAREIEDSDTQIIYDKGKKIETIDPNGFFSNLTFTLTEQNSEYVLTYDIVFAKPMEKSDIIIRTWDERKNSADTKIFDAWKIVESENNKYIESKKVETISESSQNVTSSYGVLPQTMSNETMSYGLNSLSNVTSILQHDDFYIMTEIKKWGGYSSESISDSVLLNEIGISAQNIPPWFKTQTKWLVSGDTSQKEFVDALKYMYKKGILE